MARIAALVRALVGLALLTLVACSGSSGSSRPAVAEPAPVELEWPDAAVVMIDAGVTDAAAPAATGR